MNIKEAIKNLELTSCVLEQAANSPQNYNSNFANYLEIMSWELEKYATELKLINEIFTIEV